MFLSRLDEDSRTAWLLPERQEKMAKAILQQSAEQKTLVTSKVSK
jgi:hypothetical protein